MLESLLSAPNRGPHRPSTTNFTETHTLTTKDTTNTTSPPTHARETRHTRLSPPQVVQRRRVGGRVTAAGQRPAAAVHPAGKWPKKRHPVNQTHTAPISQTIIKKKQIINNQSINQ